MMLVVLTSEDHMDLVTRKLVLGFLTRQGCHSISISKFPDFSLTFP